MIFPGTLQVIFSQTISKKQPFPSFQRMTTSSPLGETDPQDIEGRFLGFTNLEHLLTVILGAPVGSGLNMM